ncbi:ANTAR domain-containing response regulator [Geodermatophilus sp. SYSU D01062]
MREEHLFRQDGLHLAENLLYAIEESVQPTQRLLAEVRQTITRLLEQEVAADRTGEVAALRREVAQLREALASRPVIERAKGILMHEYGINEDQAFERLNELAQRHRRKVRDVAGEITSQCVRRRLTVAGHQNNGAPSAHGALDAVEQEQAGSVPSGEQ